MEDFQHKIALKELGLSKKKYPKEIIDQINTFDILKKRYYNEDTQEYKPGKLQELQVRSAKIADDMQTFIEEQLPEADEHKTNPEETTKPTNTMELTPEQIERAKAVGLTEKATIAQIEEAEIEAHAQKTKADADAAEALELEAKKAKEAEQAEKEKNKPKAIAHQEEDILDELGI
jgi:NACalpha-BTF3-like transcription factor